MSSHEKGRNRSRGNLNCYHKNRVTTLSRRKCAVVLHRVTAEKTLKEQARLLVEAQLQHLENRIQYVLFDSVELLPHPPPL